MGHLDFHGIGGDWHTSDLDVFERLLRKLDENCGKLWLASAIDWHKYVTEAKYARVTAVPTVGGYEVALSVAPLDDRLDNHPLTVVVDGKVRVDLRPGERKTVSFRNLNDN